MLEQWDDDSERRLVALALHGVPVEASRAREALAACPPANRALRGLLDGSAGYEVDRERKLVAQVWPHTTTVDDLAHHLGTLARRRLLLRRVLRLAAIYRDGDDYDVAEALRRTDRR